MKLCLQLCTPVLIIAGFLVMGLGLLGCQSLVLNESASAIPAHGKKPRTTGGNVTAPAGKLKKNVQVEGSGLMLGRTDNLAYTEREFAQLLSGLLQMQKQAAVGHMVTTYPDITRSLLLLGPCDELDFTETLQLAGVADLLWSTDSPAPDAWTDYARLGENNSGGEVPFHRLRRQFLDLLTDNSPEAALKLKLLDAAEKSGSGIARLESIRLEASAHLLLGNFKRSVQLLQSGIESSRHGSPVLCSRLMLLMADAARHLGDAEQCSANWSSATELESRTMASGNWHDPAFWKQAAFQRPVDLDWPVPVVARFRAILEQSGLQFPESLNTEACRESMLWAVVGLQSLKRHESQNAILAFKKSEGLVTSAGLKNELLLQQALSLLDAGQAGPASAILFRLTNQPGLMASRSRAVLGSLKLQHGSIEQGLNLLESALPTADQWPEEERLRAQSDFALATLIRSDDAQGLEMLEDALLQFVRIGNFSHTVQALNNLARYHETKRNNSKHSQALLRLQDFEATGTIVPASL